MNFKYQVMKTQGQIFNLKNDVLKSIIDVMKPGNF